MLLCLLNIGFGLFAGAPLLVSSGALGTCYVALMTCPARERLHDANPAGRLHLDPERAGRRLPARRRPAAGCRPWTAASWPRGAPATIRWWSWGRKPPR